MRRAYAAVIMSVILLFPEILFAQHPAEPAAQYVTSFTGSADILSVTGANAGYEITVWLVNGQYDYVLRLSSLTFANSTDCNAVNNVPLDEIVRDVSGAAVKQGVGSGYPSCSTTAFTHPVRVWVQACGTRSGTGCLTSFSACGTSWIYRSYTVDCPGTGEAATIECTGGTYSSCSGQCSPTHQETQLE